MLIHVCCCRARILFAQEDRLQKEVDAAHLNSNVTPDQLAQFEKDLLSVQDAIAEMETETTTTIADLESEATGSADAEDKDGDSDAG